jgi:serine/threonine-protein kinase PknG
LVTVTCTTCGKPVPAAEEFCPECGAKVGKSAPVAAPAAGASTAVPAACPSCGTEATGTQKFCRRCGAKLPDPAPGLAQVAEQNSPLAAGALVAEKYRIQKVLAQGGMGFLYLAEDVLLQRTVVLKTAVRQNDAELIRQQAEEYRFLAAIKHPNIVGIYEVIHLLSLPAIVMEYVRGETIAKLMEAQNAPLAADEAVGYILQILPAFSYLHKFEGTGLVYQDFKLQNMMREQLKDGSYRVVLIDLGTVARANDPGAPLWGTRGYYPPELEDKTKVIRPTPQTDLYTIGRALLEMVTGMDIEEPLFGLPPASDYAVLTRYPALYRFLERACHADPAARFQSAEEMVEQLRGVLRQITGGRADEPFASARFVNPDYVVMGRCGPRAATMLDRQDSAYALLRDGDVAVRLGSAEKAREKYEQAVRTGGQSGQARLRLFDFLLAEGDPGAPAMLTEAAGLLAPQESWQLRWYRAKQQVATGDLVTAERTIRELMAFLPGEITPQVELARILRLQGRGAEAFAIAAQMAFADPANGLAIAELAATLRHLKAGPEQLQAVIPVLEQLQTKTDFAPFYLLQGDFYRAARALAQQGAVPPSVIPHWPGVQRPSVQTFALAAEAGYQEYLRRAPSIPSGEREEIVRIKLAAAPWRWL